MSEKSLKKLAVSSSVGAGIGIAVSSVLIIALAAVLAIGNIPAMLISPLTSVILAMGAFCGGFLGAKLSGENGLFCGAISGIIFFLVAWALGGVFEIAGFGISAVIKSAMLIISGAFGGIIGVNYIKR